MQSDSVDPSWGLGLYISDKLLDGASAARSRDHNLSSKTIAVNSTDTGFKVPK